MLSCSNRSAVFSTSFIIDEIRDEITDCAFCDGLAGPPATPFATSPCRIAFVDRRLPNCDFLRKPKFAVWTDIRAARETPAFHHSVQRASRDRDQRQNLRLVEHASRPRLIRCAVLRLGTCRFAAIIANFHHASPTIACPGSPVSAVAIPIAPGPLQPVAGQRFQCAVSRYQAPRAPLGRQLPCRVF